MAHHVTGILSDARAAERAVHAAVHGLVEGGLEPDDISIVVTDRAGQHQEVVEHDTGVAEGAIGAVAGGLEVGALAGLGFWKDEARLHAEALARGGVIVAVPAEHGHAEVARKTFTEAGAAAARG